MGSALQPVKGASDCVFSSICFSKAACILMLAKLLA